MKELLFGLTDHIYSQIQRAREYENPREVTGIASVGDAQFRIDDLAEAAASEYLHDQDAPVAVFSEGEGLRLFGGGRAETVFILDPIDGTRPAAANLEMACISVASAPLRDDALIDDVECALLKEVKTGAFIYGDRESPSLFSSGYPHRLPSLSNARDLATMYWSFELNGHPSRLITNVLGHLIDRSANTGGVFVFTSASYSISRIITGQLDAYVDVGNRLLRDQPALRPVFELAGNGRILHLFPYDIAASVFLANKAGVTITDAYGRSLGDTLLMDVGEQNQRSCVAAATADLHESLLQSIAW